MAYSLVLLVIITRVKVIWQQVELLQTGGFWPPKSPLPRGSGPLSNTVLLVITLASLPNGISFHPMALAGCMSVTDDTHTDVHTEGETHMVTTVAIGRITDDFGSTVE